ncbi:MAG: sigma 54-interacting transcriptional regulator [Ignavibacteriales bacterium]|nr:sigma 54-interacting transcriptional regulator [Ignavibacteriota bacterium]MCB9249467.1 sigma 54-interacting transcriptional regulator [Ignavibacteriales bacterium]
MKTKTSKSLTNTHAELILDNVADGVFTVDENLVITYFNKAAEKITGMPRENVLGEYCFDVLRSNICETECPIRFSLETGQDVIDKRENILRIDGKKIPITISAAIVKDNKGNMIGGVETFRDLSKIEALEKEIHKKYTFEDIISKNHKVMQIFSILPNISESDSSVLIQGASGTGKELFARAIHNLSLRKDGPFIAVNCSALPDTLIESELFGYVKGAFTDAVKNKPGRFELAKGGTIFLDEIDSIPLSTQVKLLRVLQEKEFEPLGATQTVKADVRVISATKDDLKRLVRQGKFRDDLFYRLDVVKIELPTLRERRDDIPLLIQHFIEKYNHHMHKAITKVSDEVMQILLNFSFEGNIRQLENIIEHAFVMCQTEKIEIEHLPPEIINTRSQKEVNLQTEIPLKESERHTILETLEKHHWDTLETSIELKIHRSTLWRKMKKYGLLQK